MGRWELTEGAHKIAVYAVRIQFGRELGGITYFSVKAVQNGRSSGLVVDVVPGLVEDISGPKAATASVSRVAPVSFNTIAVFLLNTLTRSSRLTVNEKVNSAFCYKSFTGFCAN